MIDAAKQAPEVQATFGVSASYSVENKGGVVGVGIGMTSKGGVIGQFTVTDVTHGTGAYFGVGAQVGVSTSKSATLPGLSISPQQSFEVNMGWGPSVGGGFSTSPDSRGAQGPAPKTGRIGFGFGAATTKGNATQTTISTTPPGSKNSEDSKDGLK